MSFKHVFYLHLLLLSDINIDPTVSLWIYNHSYVSRSDEVGKMSHNFGFKSSNNHTSVNRLSLKLKLRYKHPLNGRFD